MLRHHLRRTLPLHHSCQMSSTRECGMGTEKKRRRSIINRQVQLSKRDIRIESEGIVVMASER